MDSQLAGIPKSSSPKIPVEPRVEEELNERKTSSDHIEVDVEDGPAFSGFAAVVEVGLRDVLGESDVELQRGERKSVRVDGEGKGTRLWREKAKLTLRYENKYRKSSSCSPRTPE